MSFATIMCSIVAGVAVAAGAAGCGAGDGGADMGTKVPSPGLGHDVDQIWLDVEPNDTPEHATREGTAVGPDVHTIIAGASAGGSDTTDCFVFRAGPMSGMFDFGRVGLCISGGITAMSATLWHVDDSQMQGAQVGHWQTVGQCMQTNKDAPIVGTDEYLLCVTATGGAGTYSARWP